MHGAWRCLTIKQLVIVIFLLGFFVLHPVMWLNFNTPDNGRGKYVNFVGFVFKNFWNSDTQDMDVTILLPTDKTLDNDVYDTDREVVVDKPRQDRQVLQFEEHNQKKNQILDYYTNNRKLPITLSNNYLINNKDICSGAPVVNVLVIVHSATQNYKRRNNIRSSYGSKLLFLPSNIRVVFLLGREIDRNVQFDIEQESYKHGDIVQGDFLDSYHNLTLKAVLGLRWVSEHCLHSQWILKVDDDVVFDMDLFLEKFATKIDPNLIHCYTYNFASVYRRGKWKVASHEFRGKRRYPWAFCPGFVTVFGSGVAQKLFTAAFVAPFFWIDDVYVYGILRTQAQVKISQDFNIRLRMGKDYEILKNCILMKLVKCNLLAMCIDEKLYTKAYQLFQIRTMQRKFRQLD